MSSYTLGQRMEPVWNSTRHPRGIYGAPLRWNYVDLAKITLEVAVVVIVIEAVQNKEKKSLNI